MKESTRKKVTFYTWRKIFWLWNVIWCAYFSTSILFIYFRSATYNTVTGDCRISDMDRHTIAGTGEFLASQDDEFLENNCVDDPVRLCDFQLLENRIMKTVDSVYQVCKLYAYSNRFRVNRKKNLNIIWPVLHRSKF